MTIDEMEKLAQWRIESEQRDLRDIAECRRMEAIDTLTGAARGATEDATKLARALLAVMPVVRAAESWSEFAQKHPYGARGDDELEDAIDQMRREMEGGK